MSWRAITEADVLTQISGAELEAIRAAALADDQDDPVAPTITQVTMEVRGYVAGCTENQLDADETKIPEELVGHAVALFVEKFIGRPAGLSIDPAGVRERAVARAHSVLRDVSKCDFKIVQPETPTTEEISSPGPKFGTRRPRRFDREISQDGI